MNVICSCEAEHGLDPLLGDEFVFFDDSRCEYILTTCPVCETQQPFFLAFLKVTYYEITQEFVLNGVPIEWWECTPSGIKQMFSLAKTDYSVNNKVNSVLEEILERRES